MRWSYTTAANGIEDLALNLLHPGARTRTVSVELCPFSVRKTGSRAFKGAKLLAQMRRVLVPLAHLPPSVRVSVGGFDTIAYVEDFARMREQLAGAEVPGCPEKNHLELETSNRWVDWEGSVEDAGFSVRELTKLPLF